MKQNIHKILTGILSEMGVVGVDPEVEISDAPEHGDYTTNVAMRLVKILKKPPMTIGQEIIELLEKSTDVKKEGIEKIDVVQPGFINFIISDDKLANQLTKVIQDKKTDGKAKADSGQIRKIMIEYTDPNPFKELHVGHLYSNAVGESLARILTFTGKTVKRSDYFGDVGMHVAKSLWGLIQKMSEDKKTLSDLSRLSLADRVHYLGQAYAIGAKAYEDKTEKMKQAKEGMKDINYLVYISAQEYMKKQFGWHPQVDYAKYVTTSSYSLSEIAELYQTGRAWSMEYFESIFKRLGTKFDYYHPESIAGEYGAQIVKKYVGSVFEESEGAIVFRGEKYGLHTRVFINSLGLPTYEAKELGLAIAKYKDFKFDLCLNVTGNEIDEYFKVVLTALQKVQPELAAKIKHIAHGMVRLPQGKMSSRTGKVKTAEWLMQEVKNKIFEILNTSKLISRDLDKDDVAEKETIAAIKYSFLKVALPSNITFDLEKSVSFEGDSGPYLLYTYARCKSVMEKTKEQSNPLRTGIPLRQTSAVSSVEPLADRDDTLPKLNQEEHDVARLLFYFPEIIEDAGKHFAPNTLCSYLFSLAQAFNLLYAKHLILGNDLRLILTEKTATTLKEGLRLLGIETVERM
ncbi:arginine--tRNA ligase [Patescibacteria group bacterium]|nr:arginine--tRNA ligase [Patescibacteria group bacterium]